MTTDPVTDADIGRLAEWAYAWGRLRYLAGHPLDHISQQLDAIVKFVLTDPTDSSKAQMVGAGALLPFLQKSSIDDDIEGFEFDVGADDGFAVRVTVIGKVHTSK